MSKNIIMDKLYNASIIRRNLSYAQLRTWYCSLRKPGIVKPPFRHIVQIGDPVLRTESANVPVEDLQSKEIISLIQHLKHVFKKYNSFGLSAPQIGVPLRIFLMEFNRNDLKQYTENEIKAKDMSLMSLMVAINPKIKVIDYNKIVHEEACESIKGFYADVPRYGNIELEAINESGETFKTQLRGWNARIVQHEIDHLNGKLYTDLMERKSLTCSCWQVVNERRGKVLLPFGPQA